MAYRHRHRLTYILYGLFPEIILKLKYLFNLFSNYVHLELENYDI